MHSRERSPAVIDIAPFFVDGLAERREVAERVGAACASTGCFLVTGHGVPPEPIARVHRLWRAFYDEPVERKRACAAPDPSLLRGYYGFASTGLAYGEGQQTPPDLRELYLLNRIDPLPAAYIAQLGSAGDYVAAPNIWPASPGELREASEAYYRLMAEVAERLLAIFTVALGLPEGYFVDRTDKFHSSLGVAHYPAQDRPPLPGQQRCGAHRDYGILTLLHQDDAPGGLQLQASDGEWIDVPPHPEALVVNLGDTMQLWTNKRWKSPLHRVVNPPAEITAATRRQSLLFFHGANYDASLAIVPTCKDPKDADEVPGSRSGELIRMKGQKGTRTRS